MPDNIHFLGTRSDGSKTNVDSLQRFLNLQNCAVFSGVFMNDQNTLEAMLQWLADAAFAALARWNADRSLVDHG